jgi:hypothetical protein
MTTKQRKALLDAEQPQTCLWLIAVMKGSGRVKSDALIAHLYLNGVAGSECELDTDLVDMGVLDCVEQQLADGFKEQDANFSCLQVGLRVGGDIHDNAVLLLCPSC